MYECVSVYQHCYSGMCSRARLDLHQLPSLGRNLRGAPSQDRRKSAKVWRLLKQEILQGPTPWEEIDVLVQVRLSPAASLHKSGISIKVSAQNRYFTHRPTRDQFLSFLCKRAPFTCHGSIGPCIRTQDIMKMTKIVTLSSIFSNHLILFTKHTFF